MFEKYIHLCSHALWGDVGMKCSPFWNVFFSFENLCTQSQIQIIYPMKKPNIQYIPPM